jgi:hypothetical protein
MEINYQIGDRVEVYLAEPHAKSAGWYAGVIVRVDPYSAHRSFYWVEFDAEVQALLGFGVISVFNPRHIRKAA